MVKKLIIFMLCSMISCVHAMDFITDTAIVLAVEHNSPDVLKKALDGRMWSMRQTFQAQVNDQFEQYKQSRREIDKRFNDALTANGAQYKNNPKKPTNWVAQMKAASAIITETRNQEMDELERWRPGRLEAVRENYRAAREKFVNDEVPAYLKLAQKNKADLSKALKGKKPLRSSDMMAKGGIMLAVALLGAHNALNWEPSLTQLVVVPACLFSCYLGSKKVMDGYNHEAYLLRECETNDAVQRILKARQGNWFEKVAYQLKGL